MCFLKVGVGFQTGKKISRRRYAMAYAATLYFVFLLFFYYSVSYAVSHKPGVNINDK